MNPWDEDDWAQGATAAGDSDRRRRLRPTSSWGCALAAIIGSVATIVVVVIVVKLLAGLVDVGELMP